MKIIAVVSGGLDSTSFMGSYSKDNDVEVITFDYGQKAQKETESLKQICDKINVPLKIIDLRFMRDLWKGTQLTDETVKIKPKYEPSVVVPLRNGVMLMIAVSYAYTVKADKVIFGSHMGDIGRFDHHGHEEYFYPDCSHRFAFALEDACKSGVFDCDKKIRLESPATHSLTKKDLVKIGYETLNDLLFETWSCYENGDKQCGKCESCNNRKESFRNADIKDMTEYDS